MLKIEFDEAKRLKTLEERGLDFARAAEVLAEASFDVPDLRTDYGEDRIISFGKLDDRYVAIVWTRRDDAIRVISMRHVHDRELENRKRTLD